MKSTSSLLYLSLPLYLYLLPPSICLSYFPPSISRQTPSTSPQTPLLKLLPSLDPSCPPSYLPSLLPTTDSTTQNPCILVTKGCWYLYHVPKSNSSKHKHALCPSYSLCTLPHSYPPSCSPPSLLPPSLLLIHPQSLTSLPSSRSSLISCMRVQFVRYTKYRFNAYLPHDSYYWQTFSFEERRCQWKTKKSVNSQRSTTATQPKSNNGC